MPYTYVKKNTASSDLSDTYRLEESSATTATIQRTWSRNDVYVYTWATESGAPNISDWQGGTWTWHFRVSQNPTGGTFTLQTVTIERISSDGSTIRASKSATYNTSISTAGVWEAGIDWSDGTQNPATRFAADRVRIKFSVKMTGTSSATNYIGTNLTTNNDEISTPLAAAELKYGNITEDSVSVGAGSATAAKTFPRTINEDSVSVGVGTVTKHIPQFQETHFVEYPERTTDTIVAVKNPTGGVTPVSTTKTHKYNVVSTVSTTKTHKYNLLQQIPQTKTHKYNLLEKITTTKTHLYNLVSVVLATKTHIFSILNAVSAAKTHLYYILNTVPAASKTHLYNLLNTVSTTKTHKYSLLNAVSTTKTHLWHILQTATALRTHKYHIIETIVQSTTHKYNLLNSVLPSKTHLYNIIGLVLATKTHLYDLESAVSEVSTTKTHKYNVSAASVLYYGTIDNEPTVNVSESIDKRLTLPKPISEPSQSISEELARIATLIRSITVTEEPLVSVGDTLAKIVTYLKNITNEPEVTISEDVLTRLALISRILSEPSTNISEDLTRIQSIIKTISDTPTISTSDSVTAGILYIVSLLESRIKWYYSLLTRKIPEDEV